MKDRILAYLKLFPNKYFFTKELVERFQIPAHDLRIIIASLRDESQPIASNTQDGYAYVTDREKLQSTIEWFENKAINHRRRAEQLKKCFINKERGLFEKE